MKEVEVTLRDRLASIVEGMKCEFVGYELNRQGKHSILRVFIDTEKGVTLDDCSKVSRQLSAMLDVEDPIPGQYTLEVSSPGLNRPLFQLEHYARFAGEQVKIRLKIPMDDRRNFVGKLLRVDGKNIHLLVDAEEIVLPFADIEKANIIAV